jgi:membrane protein
MHDASPPPSQRKQETLLQRIIHSKPYRATTGWMKRVHLGHTEISLYLVTVIFLRKVRDNDLSTKATSVAFNFTTAIFPAIIFLFTLVPYLPVEGLRDQLFSFFNDFSPDSMHAAISGTVFDIIDKPRGNLLSFGFISAMYLASNGVNSLIDAFNSCYHGAVKQRSFFRKRMAAASITFMLAFILVLNIVALIAGRVILDTLVDFNLLDENFLYYLIDLLRYVIVIFMLFLAVSVLYYFGPSIQHRWKFASPGAAIATALIVGFSVLFSFYIDNFGTYNKLYGSIGVMLGVMLWLLAISHVLLIGFEVNSTIDMARDRLGQLQQELEEDIEKASAWQPAPWRGTR